MSAIAKKYHVRVLDQEYIILSDESQEHVLRVATQVDQIMRDIALKRRGTLDVKKSAVLAALKLASDVLKHEEQLDRYQKEHERFIQLIDAQ